MKVDVLKKSKSFVKKNSSKDETSSSKVYLAF